MCFGDKGKPATLSKARNLYDKMGRAIDKAIADKTYKPRIIPRPSCGPDPETGLLPRATCHNYLVILPEESLWDAILRHRRDHGRVAMHLVYDANRHPDSGRIDPPIVVPEDAI